MATATVPVTLVAVPVTSPVIAPVAEIVVAAIVEGVVAPIGVESIAPPSMFTLFAACVDIVPKPVIFVCAICAEALISASNIVPSSIFAVVTAPVASSVVPTEPAAIPPPPPNSNQ